MMLTFQVNDMTCGHCVGAITAAINDVAPGAGVQCDLPAHRVTIQTDLPAATIQQAITQAGYTPVALNQPPGLDG